MHYVIWSGAALTVLGIVGILYCVWLVLSIKRANLPDAEARAAMQRVVAVNMAALFVSFFGLMIVLVGVILA
ncbi:MAG: hypothetical protein ACOH2M_02790 [Cypionkella sp.]|jgi:hypothetical protein